MNYSDIRQFGAVPDSSKLSTTAIQMAIDHCADAGGGCVYVGHGAYLCGSLQLRTNIEFHIDVGARIVASPNPEDLPAHALLWAENAVNVVISGHGIVDGNDHAYHGYSNGYHIDASSKKRPVMLQVINCKRISIKDVTFVNAPFWTIHPIGCEDVAISNISIDNNLAMQNSDGIDIDHCRNVHISDCFISCADDCIVIKNTRPYSHFGSCENITVKGCTLTSTSAAFKIGSETVNDFRNIIFSDCIITQTNRAIGLQLRDEGNIENILIQNIICDTRLFFERYWGKAEPIFITAYPRRKGGKCGRIRRIRIQNIFGDCEAGIYIEGREGNIQAVCLHDINLEISKKTKWQGGLFDRRPVDEKPFYQAEMNGICLLDVKDIHLRDVHIHWRDRQAYYGAVLCQDKVVGLDIKNVTESWSGK